MTAGNDAWPRAMMHDLARDVRHACTAAAAREWLLRAANGGATAHELSE